VAALKMQAFPASPGDQQQNHTRTQHAMTYPDDGEDFRIL
jgi:hypothetical protein